MSCGEAGKRLARSSGGGFREVSARGIMGRRRHRLRSGLTWGARPKNYFKGPQPTLIVRHLRGAKPVSPTLAHGFCPGDFAAEVSGGIRSGLVAQRVWIVCPPTSGAVAISPEPASCSGRNPCGWGRPLKPWPARAAGRWWRKVPGCCGRGWMPHARRRWRPAPRWTCLRFRPGTAIILAASAHDPRNGETHWPAGRFFALHLKGQSRFPLTLADLSARKREHDARARKRPRVAQLRPGAGPGRRGLWVWDQAGVDLAFWQDRKASGRYFLSRRKAGMCLELEQERSL